jgi:hypothetical protein
VKNLYTVVLSKQHDPTKPDLIFCDLSRRLNKETLYVNRFLWNTAQILSKDFNIFVFSLSNSQKNAQPIMEAYDSLNFVFLDDKNLGFLKKKEDEDFLAKNKQIVVDMILRDLTVIDDLKGIFFKPNVLYKTDMQNELHDTISSDPEKIQIAEDEIKKMNDMITETSMYPYSMFMTKAMRVIIDTFDYYLNNVNPKPMVYHFVIDPAFYYLYYNRLHNGKAYYFENDSRGSRDLLEFPIGQLNYFYNAEKVEVPDFKDKNNSFIWGGVVLAPKGERMQDFARLLKDFNHDKSVLHIAKANSIRVVKKARYSKQLEEHPLFETTREMINNHPLNHDLLPNAEFEEKLKDYKYTLILKCLSENDSLNFRIHYSLLYNMLPFVDKDYDFDCLQIPAKFRDKLLVDSDGTLSERIEYFENHQDEAAQLLAEMKDHYMNDKYFKEEYYYEAFKNKYFAEIYK